MRALIIAASALVVHAAVAAASLAADAPANDEKYPLGDQLRVLADDVASPAYRKLVVEDMLSTDLAAEWQRVETLDNADAFVEAHGGRKTVLDDPELRAAYERRLAIRDKFLDLMREGFRRYNIEPPFDKGAQAEKAGTTTRRRGALGPRLSTMLPAPGADRWWPRFRGPGGQGNSAAQGLPTVWASDSPNILWRTSIPGRGNSSPVIWADRIFLTSAGPEGTNRTVHCLSQSDGRVLWSRVIPDHPPEQRVRADNGFASSTPVTDGERVIAFFGTGGLVCYDNDGKLQWHFPLDNFQTVHGSGSSPLLYEDIVILMHDQNVAESIFLALDKATGALRWRQPRDKAMGWCTPVVVRVDDHDELLFAGGEKVKGYDPRTGRELWSLNGPTVEVVPTIVVGEDLLYSASGRNGPTLALRPGGEGDVTESHFVWRAVRGGPHVPSPVYYAGRLYTVNDTGICTCLDAQTGKLVWQERIRDKFSASPLEAQGLVYACGHSGATYVFRAGDQFELVAKNELGSPIMASPAALDGVLYLRTQEELLAIAGPGRNAAIGK